MNSSVKNILNTIFFVFFCILIYKYWDEIGIFFIENILVIDISTVLVVGKVTTKSIVAKKTFFTIVKKIGYKKFFVSIIWVIIKRFLIEQITNYFKKHSFKRFKNNFIEVLKLKMKEIKNTSFVKKIMAFFYFLLGGSFFYYFLTTYIGKILIGLLQKIFYILILFIGKFLTLVFGLSVFIFTSIIQIFFVIKIINYIEQFTIVKWFYSIVSFIFKKFLYFLDYIFGTKIHLSLIKLSRRLDEYFASILDKNFSGYEVIQRRRDRYINGIEYISVQRERYILKKREVDKTNTIKYYNKLLKKYISKKKTWKEKRAEFYRNRELRVLKSKQKLKKVIRKDKLTLPNKKIRKTY